MPKEEWGTKRLCPHCATRFYDLNNDPMTCPACSNEITLQSFTDGRSKSLISEKKASKDQSNHVETDDDIDDDSGDLDDDLLEDDDDDADVSLDEIADVSDDDDE